jgi:hypothetical protein
MFSSAVNPGAAPPASRSGCCPSCGHQTQFNYLGEQRWPERVAKAAGISPVVRLWDCQQCHSTISEQNLH